MRLENPILVVDDDDAIRALLRTVLRRRGFQVDTARNGVDALEQIGARRYALVVLDLMMPRLSGYEVVAQLAGQSVMTRPRVLVLTAAGFEPLKITVPDLVVGTMQKPFDIDLLLDTVTGCLEAIPAALAAEEVPLPAASRLN
jgi:DNA-binding response OmpR family regulator